MRVSVTSPTSEGHGAVCNLYNAWNTGLPASLQVIIKHGN